MKKRNQTKIIHSILSIIGLALVISCNNIHILKESYKTLDANEKKLVDSYKTNIEKAYNKDDNEIVLILQYNCFVGKTIKIEGKEEVEFKKEDENRYVQKISKINKNKKNINLLMDGKILNIKFIKDYDYIRVCYNEAKKEWVVIYYDFPKAIIPH